MNYLIIGKMRIFLCLITLSFLACGTDQGSTDTYTVRNESRVKIKIIGYVDAYKGGVPYVAKHITNLDDGESLTKTFEDGLPPRGYTWHSFYGSSNGNRAADSIKIIYNNLKYRDFNYENIDDSRNPLSKINDVRTIGLFIYTVEDYENAEDCNGNCE